MSEQEKKLDGPDFARGVPLEDLAEGSMILGQAAGEAVAGGGYRPLPLAPCLLQPAHRRGIARPGAGPGRVLACRPTGRKNLCPRQA